MSIPRRSSFKHHRFPREIIPRAVRWYLRYPLSYQDVVDLLAERGIMIDRSTVYRWVQKFGPELTKRTEKHLRRASVDWHVDEPTLSGLETIRTIKRDQIHHKQLGHVDK